MTKEIFRRRKILWTGLALLIVLGLIWKVGAKPNAGKSAESKSEPVLVDTAQVRQQDMPIFLPGVGTVAANASVTVKTRIDGQLDKVYFTEGQDVKEGQLLAEIDPRTLQAQLSQIRAQRAKDAAQLANAKNDLQRYTKLREDDAATQQTLDAQKAQVAQLEAALQGDDAQIESAEVQLSYTRITAPISGKAGARLVDAGNIIHAADPNGLVVINQIDPIMVVFSLPGDTVSDINRAQQGGTKLAVIAYTRDEEKELARGVLVLLNNQIDTSSGTVALKGRFANPSHALWPGQYVNVRLQLGTSAHALTVPASAIQRSQDGTYVYLVGADGKAQDRKVTVDRIQDGIAVISKGLQTGEHVVVDGQYKLKPGAPVTEANKTAVGNPAKGTAN